MYKFRFWFCPVVHLYFTNWQQFSLVYTLIDHRNDIKMFQTQVKPRATGKWFHRKVFNILTSFLWTIRVYTDLGKLLLIFFTIPFRVLIPISVEMSWKILCWRKEKKMRRFYHIISMVCILIEHHSRPISWQEITQLW